MRTLSPCLDIQDNWNLKKSVNVCMPSFWINERMDLNDFFVDKGARPFLVGAFSNKSVRLLQRFLLFLHHVKLTPFGDQNFQAPISFKSRISDGNAKTTFLLAKKNRDTAFACTKKFRKT